MRSFQVTFLFSTIGTVVQSIGFLFYIDEEDLQRWLHYTRLLIRY
jgi:hypothetical protein